MASSVLQQSENHAIMNVEAVLHMKEGLGEHSYAKNSSLQRKSMDTLRNVVVNSAVDVYLLQRPERFTVADLGCASGPNALSLVEEIILSIGGICRLTSRPPPEFLVLLNDLPTNDFNTVFAGQPGFLNRLKSASGAEERGRPTVFLSGVPGSFYGRIFPRKSIHFVSSCSSLHWLSQVPPGVFDSKNRPLNKGKMYISHTSPAAVLAAYLEQFRRDFSAFLRSRSEEVVSGGKMVLAMLGRQTEGAVDMKSNLLWELLAEAFVLMAEQGIIRQEALDAYNVPFYAPCVKEIEDEVSREGSFTIDYIQNYEMRLSTGDAEGDGHTITMAIRAVQEPMLRHFLELDAIDALFRNYAALLAGVMEKQEIVVSVQVGVVLTRV